MAQQSFNAVKARDEIVDRLLGIAFGPKYEGGQPMNDPDDDELRAFLEKSLQEIVEHLEDNAWSAKHQITTDEAYDLVDNLLVDENIEEISVQTNGRFGSPHVYVWMTQSSLRGERWANTATKTTFKFSQHREHYNGKQSHAILDVRPM